MPHERSAAFALGVTVAIAFGVVGVPTARAQISPGTLSSAHASLDGPLNCTKCHSGGGATMNDRCLGCHREIGWLVAQNRGVHARIGRAACASCHPDHAGRAFNLVKWPDGSPDRFDHTRAGWALEEKHARVPCAKCHTSDLRVSPAVPLAPKRSTPGWVGLETTCMSCHTDVHSGDLGRDCGGCHSTAQWAPAPRFDHARTSYALTGKHTDVDCERCHTPPARSAGAANVVARFQPVTHADCASCHRDPHAGRLRGMCSTCHTTTSFATVDARAFSHDRTRFALRGRHASVRCVACHTGYPARVDQPPFATCGACHADPHNGQATLGGAATDCASCHGVAGFVPSTFTLAQHAQTAYPLDGRHTTVSCSGCHVRPARAAAGIARTARTETVIRPAADRCESCHAPAHAEQLALRDDGGACASCHRTSGWTPSTFGVHEHAALGFPLTGRHATAACASCHAAGRRGLPALPATRSLGRANVALALTESTCESCHSDPHGGRYADLTTNRTTTLGSCANCHDTQAFQPSTLGVDVHARFTFPLDGAHRAVTCVACHTTMARGTLGASLKLAPPLAVPRAYSLPGASCAGCHGAPHGTQFAGRVDRGACESCHDLRGWTPASRFVHEANGGFALGTAHVRVACDRCHALAAGAPPAQRTWRGVPRACEACHRGGGRVSE